MWKVSCAKSWFAWIKQNNKGDVAILFGVLAVVLVLMIGGAVDFGRWLHARNQTIAAMDSAVLAGGRSLQVDPSDQFGAITAAQAFYNQNVQSRSTVVNDTIGFVVGDDGKSVISFGNAYVTTPFLGVANIHHLAILDETGDEHPKSEVGVGGRSKKNIELSLMLDVTGSMEGTRLADLKEAATDLVNIIVEHDQSQSKSRIAMIPTSEGVRLPSSALAMATGVRPDSLSVSESHLHPYLGLTTINRTYFLTDCIGERMGSDAFTDVMPGPGNYVVSVYKPHSSRACLPVATNELMPLSDNKSDLITAIGNLSAGGEAAVHVGVAWSWYAISPNWNGVWSSNRNYASSYGAANTQKIAVLMTDGEFNTQYSDAGIAVDGDEAPSGSSLTQVVSLCTAMKEAGVLIYTVSFDLDEGSEAHAAMMQCANDVSKVFTADDGDDLKQAMRAVALEISRIYLSS